MPDLHHGPLIKSLYTQQLELLVKFMLYSPNDVKLHSQSNDKNIIHAKIGNVEINLTTLLKKANLTHINITEADSARYMATRNRDRFNAVIDFIGKAVATVFSRAKVDFLSEFVNLTVAEKHAIAIYTGSGYKRINDFLYSKNPSFGMQPTNNKESVLQAVFLGSGLNKIMPNPSNHKVKSYRGERHTSAQEIQERIKLVNQGGGYTDHPAFMSTSTSRTVANSFSGGKCIVIFDSVYGANVQRLSSMLFSEKEFLLPPGQIYWKGYEFINGCHTFRADAVRPLIPAKDEHSPEDMANFNKLLELAHQKGIPYHFVTPTLHKDISSPHIKTAVASAQLRHQQLTHQELIKHGLMALGLLGLGIFMLSLGFGLIPAVAGASWTSTLIGGFVTFIGAEDLKATITQYIKQRNIVPTAPVQIDIAPAPQATDLPEMLPGSEPQEAVHNTLNPYNTLLETEQNAIKALESALIDKHQAAPQFINKLHTVLGLDKPHHDKLLLLQYAHILEDKVNDAQPEQFALVEQEVLNEATTAMKDNSLFPKN